MRVLFLVLFSILILPACSDDSQRPILNPDPGVVTDITERGLCSSRTPRGISLSKSDWIATHRSPEGILLQRTMIFRGDSLTVIVDADYRGDHRQVKVRANIQASESAFDILTSDQARHPEPLGPYQRTIQFSLEPMTMQYNFIGRCLQLQSTDGKTVTLIPKDRESRK